MTKNFLMIFLLIFISGCSVTQPRSEKVIVNQSKNTIIEQKIFLNNIKKWSTSSKIAIITKKEKQSLYLNWSINLYNNEQKMIFSHPLKGKLATIITNKDTAVLKTTNNKYTEKNLRKLINRLLNIDIPAFLLKDISKGYPLKVFKNKKYNKNGYLISSEYLENDVKWNLEWFYEDKKLPTFILLKNNDITLKISINKWTF